MKLYWEQDGADFSWHAEAPDGTHFSAKRVFDAGDGTRWVIAWTEEDGIRIGAGSHADADEAKRECEELAAVA